MKFAEPIWLLAGLAVIAALLWLYHRFDLRQRAALAEFASSHLLAQLTASFSPARRRFKRALFVAAIAFVFLALARPQWGYHWEEQKQRGIDILFAIDTSKSMLTQDVNPDRLTRAKLAITDFVKKLDGDRVGLIAFAGDAFLQAPLTLDTDAFLESLDAIDTGTIPRGGTDISSAIQEARVALGPETRNRKILVLVTDGEDLEAKGIDAARDAAKDGLTIYTVGVGTPSGGLIPVPGANGGTDFVKDGSGQFVKSQLDESTLKQIAAATGGIYEPFGRQGEGLEALYNQVLASLPKHDLTSRAHRVYDERFQWPLALGLACLLAGMMIGTRKRETRKATRPQKTLRTAATVGVLALSALGSSTRASVQSAEQAYKKGDFTTAEKQYQQAVEQRPEAAPLQFNLGASAYKSGQFDLALPAFQKALGTDQIPVQQQAYYDIGNTQYRLGQQTEKSAPQQTIKAWQDAIQSYEAALKLQPDDADAKFNRDFVQKKLDQLQKQQQKQDQQNQNQQNQNQQNQQSQSQSSSTQNKDQQNQQSQSGSPQNQRNNQSNQQDQKQSGSPQSQPQDGNPEQNQNGQQGQPKDQPSGQPQSSGNEDQNSSMAQNGMKPAGPQGATIPDKDQSKPQVSAGAAQADQPGEMTAQEAKDLLNSMKNGEHVLGATADARNTGNHPLDEQVLKDW